ncbi:MAG: hypothetical protein QOE61_163 [Micromonosporaceae bacterium]|jgi:hypothetical protein|nr:hypothetical protein [Micromonosporaceae bacterium]
MAIEDIPLDAGQPATTQQPQPAAPPPSASRRTYRDQWAELMTTTGHTPHDWAVISDAIRVADSSQRDADSEPVDRGGEEWCRRAINAIAQPRRSYDTFPDVRPEECIADPDTIRTWLTAPAPWADQSVVTIADRIDLADWSQASDDRAHQCMDELIVSAQDAGVFGVSGYQAELVRTIDADSWYTGHLLVARPEFGPGLASPQLPDGALVPAGSTPLEGAVAVLVNAANEVNTVLNTHAVVLASIRAAEHRPAGTPQSSDGDRTGGRPRPFPAPTLPAAQPGPADQATTSLPALPSDPSAERPTPRRPR